MQLIWRGPKFHPRQNCSEANPDVPAPPAAATGFAHCAHFAVRALIVSTVERLGFDVEDIRIILSSHAHWDHVQGHAAMSA